METIRFARDGVSRWAGMGDYALVSPDGRRKLNLKYVGEPPHGDSIHELWIEGRRFPGWFWGDHFAFSSNSRYFIASWMEQKFQDRRTVFIDLECSEYCCLLGHLAGSLDIQWPSIRSNANGEISTYTVSGHEVWTSFSGA